MRRCFEAFEGWDVVDVGKKGGEGVRGVGWVGWGLGIVVVFRISESRYFSLVVFILA